ncbi:bis-aminopropyl spermidine synthase family protein [Nocardiopsis sp. HNM0947]|uniref:Bis-aminopropyl spermidine synthase family protein n=1 Tax=Nocardiopsis coralli TaxID=2772213 RepID=A0ABR9P0C7_9ACTN|nr:bis-aminopropyl spermidine synthase family protein [Nocardiopsis coralli]MBE2997296.1 bis-aminopropyl spermidine synthase family protein [Nocardiopsis coralli]
MAAEHTPSPARGTDDPTYDPGAGQAEPPSGAGSERVRALLRERGVDAPRAQRVVDLLADGRVWRPNELVRDSAVAHAVVAELVRALVEAGEAVEEDPGVRLVRPAEHAGAPAPAVADPVAHLAVGRAGVLSELERAVAEGPASDLDLDHVAATAETALRRALFLTTRFDLVGRTVLCVGDHDLTSIALALVEPRARAVVVDLDERVLAHIGALAERLGADVTTYAADLRLGLPPALRGTADVVFTDPPYTPDGVELFVRRGLEGMADPRRGRVLVAYGVSETTPRLAAATQARLLRLDLVVEALWPDFNRYHGAESIGAASDLYVLRPLSRSVPSPGGEDARVYSQGANAREARVGSEPERAAAVLERAGEGSEAGEPLLVGFWPQGFEGAGRVRLSTWMEAPGAVHAHAVVDLTGGWERLAARAALAAPAGTRVVDVLVPSSSAWVRDRSGQEAFRALVEPRFGVRFLRGFGAGDLTSLRLIARSPEAGADPAEALAAHVQGRAHGTLTSTLRAGLVEVSAAVGSPVNKRTARHTVARAPGWVRGHTVVDLPEQRLRELREVCADLWAQLG